jgi:hypothetical protein
MSELEPSPVPRRDVGGKLLYNRRGYLRLQYNLRPSWPDLIRPSVRASPLAEGVDGRVEHGHDETWSGL